MLEGIDEDAVDFRTTYDGEDREPVVLPARFPNLLANGAAGIAVGMATSIPPHNAGELCGALLQLIDNPEMPAPPSWSRMSPAPIFRPAACWSSRPESIAEAYATGRGSFRLRARWDKEPLSHGLYQIVVTEIPYQVPKSRLIEKIAALLEEKKLPLLADIRDEVDRARSASSSNRKTATSMPTLLMEQLFRLTELETRVPLNLNVIDPLGVPRVMNLKETLQAFLDHRREVLQRRSRHRLASVARRIEVLRGFIIVYLNLDEVIRIIREADDPKAEMMARWDLTEVQVEAILNMRLRALRRLEEIAIKKELNGLAAESSQAGSAARPARSASGGRWPRRSRERSGIRRRYAARAPPHTDRHRSRADRDPGRSAGRARADYRAAVAKGLDPRRTRTRHQPGRAEIQGGRRAALCGAGRNDRPAGRIRYKRTFLYDRSRPLAGRSGPRRTVAADDRPAE